MYTISVFKTVSDESVQAIHACQIRRGKLPTKNQKRLSLLGTKLFFKQILSLFTDPLFSLYRCRARTWKYKLGGIYWLQAARGWGGGNENVCARAFLGKLPTYPSPKTTFCPKWEESIIVGLGEGWVGSFPEKCDPHNNLCTNMATLSLVRRYSFAFTSVLNNIAP